ncbi:GNAT family N-acetyltransferase [Mariniblastus sp.]|nr:GNAT family N-acetyltransferase [Mariniblastus sp.]MDB4724287.1 GNAT family N-acetyltransferase [bacterium]MDB4757101.1 GNAT family N-acetyltransferase [Mariniblastus sp.]
MKTEIEIRQAISDDAECIYQLTEPFVTSGELLRRSRDEIKSLIPHGFTAIQKHLPEDLAEQSVATSPSGAPQGGLVIKVVGFAAVEIYSKKLAEILCLAVCPTCQNQGVGKKLVEQCVQFAKENDVQELMAISSSDHFLKHCGFDYSLPNQKRALFVHPNP